MSTMGSKVISFRFNDDEIEALQALQTLDDESLSQTAARLLRNVIGLSTPSTRVDNLEELIDKRVEIGLAEVRKQLAELRGKSKAR